MLINASLVVDMSKLPFLMNFDVDICTYNGFFPPTQYKEPCIKTGEKK